MAKFGKSVTVIFYEVVKRDEGVELPFGEVLEKIYQKQHSERIFTDDEGYDYLLCALKNDGDNFEGDFIRIDKNYGASIGVYEINEEELKTLKDENIAQGSAFLYNKSDNIFALQKTFLGSNVQSFVRFSKYIEKFYKKQYTFTYVMKGNIKDVLAQKEIRKIEVGLSQRSLSNMPSGDPISLIMGSKEFFGADKFVFSLSVKGGKLLDHGVKKFINYFMTPGGTEATKLNVLLEEEEEMINLLKDYILSYKETLHFPQKNPVENRAMRIEFLRRAVRKNSSYF